MDIKHTDKITFRIAELNETDDIFTIFSAAISDLENKSIFQWDDIYPNKENIKNDILNKTLYIGIVSGKIISAFTLSRECDAAYNLVKWSVSSFTVLHRLCIHPNWQNKGYGRITMKYVENMLITDGIQSLRLDAFSKNPYSIKLYKSMGYIKVGCANWRKGLFYLYEKCL